MNPPKIFISATSGDLSSARQIAKEALLTINCHPVEQTNFEPDWRSVTDMLRGKIGDCQALIHLVGFHYGAEPDPATLPSGTPRRSYTQMEYHLARELGLRVYTFLLPETYPFDVPAKADTPEQTQLQTAHRALIQSSPHLYEKPANDLDLRTRIIALQEQVISLVQEQQSIAKEVKTTRHWGLWVTATFLLILSSIGVWQSQIVSQVQVVSQKQDEQTNLLKDQSNLLREAVVQLEQLTEEKARLGIKFTDLPSEAVEKELATRVGVSALELRLNIEAGKKSQDALTRAHANLLAGKLADAHAAAKEVRDAETSATKRIIESHQVDGQAYFQEVKYESALESYQKAAVLVDKRADPMLWADAQGWVAFIQLHLAHYEDAEAIIRENIRLRELNLDAQHPDLIEDLSNLAQVLQDTDRPTEAEPLMRRVLISLEKSASDKATVSATAVALNNLAQLLQDTNRLNEAEPLMRRALKIDETALGPDNPKVAVRLNNLARLLHAMGQMKEAEPLMRRALKIDQAAAIPDNRVIAIRLNNLGLLLQDMDQLTEAESLFRVSLETAELGFGPDHPKVAIRLNNLAMFLHNSDRKVEAEPLMRRALTIDEKTYGSDHPQVASDLNNLSQILEASNRYTEAEPLSLRMVGIFFSSHARNGRPHHNCVAALENYISLCEEMNLPHSEIHARLDRERQKANLESEQFEAIWTEATGANSTKDSTR